MSQELTYLNSLQLNRLRVSGCPRGLQLQDLSCKTEHYSDEEPLYLRLEALSSDTTLVLWAPTEAGLEEKGELYRDGDP